MSGARIGVTRAPGYPGDEPFFKHGAGVADARSRLLMFPTIVRLKSPLRYRSAELDSAETERAGDGSAVNDRLLPACPAKQTQRRIREATLTEILGRNSHFRHQETLKVAF